LMAWATTTRIAAVTPNDSSATSFSEMTMISADRMKSVRTAPDTMVSLSGAAPRSRAWASDGRCRRCHTFSAALVAEVRAAEQ
jgi:hypothetical protein